MSAILLNIAADLVRGKDGLCDGDNIPPHFSEWIAGKALALKAEADAAFAELERLRRVNAQMLEALKAVRQYCHAPASSGSQWDDTYYDALRWDDEYYDALNRAEAAIRAARSG